MSQQRRKRKTRLEVQEAPEVVEVICEEGSVNTSYEKHKKPDELKMSSLPSFRRGSMPSLAVSGGTAKSTSREPEGYGQWGGSGFSASATKSFVPNLGQSSLPLPQPAYNTRAHRNPTATVVIENSDDEDQSSEPLTPGTTAMRNVQSAGDNYYMSSLNNFGSSPPPPNKTRDLLDVVEASPSPPNRSEGSGRETPRPLAKIFRPRPAVSQSSPIPSIFTESIPSPATVQSSPLSTFSSSACTHLVDYGDSSGDDFESVPSERHPKQASDNTSDGDLVRRPLHNNNNAQTFYPSSCMRNSNSGTWLSARQPPPLPSYNIKRRSNRPMLLNRHKDNLTAAEATTSIMSTYRPPPARDVRTRQGKRKMAVQGHSAEDPVLCVSDDEEEVLETVEKPATTTNKKDRQAEIDEYRPPSASKVTKRNTRATAYSTRSKTGGTAPPRLSTKYEFNDEVILDVATVRFGTLETTAIGVQVEGDGVCVSVDYFNKSMTLKLFFSDVKSWKMSLDPSSCAIVLLLSVVSGRGLQTRIRSRFGLSDQFLDPASTRTDQRFIVFQLSRSPDKMSADVLDTILKDTGLQYVQLNGEAMQKLLESIKPVNSPGPPQTPARVDHETPVRRSARLLSSSSECSSGDLLIMQDPHKQVLFYPVPGTKHSFSITNEDLMCLLEGEYLNDKIINFYLTHLWLNLGDKKDSVHLFNSFFYARLSSSSFDTSKASSQDQVHSRVSSWTRHVDLFTKDYIIVPICHRAHWFVAIICYPGLYDPNAPPVHAPQPTVSSTTKRRKKRRKLLTLKRRRPANESPEKKENNDNIVLDLSTEEEEENVLEEELGEKSINSSLIVEENPVKVMESPENTEVAQEEEVELCVQGEDSGLSAVVVDCTDKEKSDDCESVKEEEEEVVMEVEREEEVGEESESSSAVEMVAANTDVDSDSTAAFSTPTISSANDSPLLLRSEGAKPAPQPNRPCVVVLDSLGLKRRRAGYELRRYLTSEWKSKKKDDEPKLFDQMTITCPSTYLQDNSSDCGIFVLQYIENLFKHIKEGLHLPNPQEWVSYEQTINKREQIRSLITSLAANS